MRVQYINWTDGGSLAEMCYFTEIDTENLNDLDIPFYKNWLLDQCVKLEYTIGSVIQVIEPITNIGPLSAVQA